MQSRGPQQLRLLLLLLPTMSIAQTVVGTAAVSGPRHHRRSDASELQLITIADKGDGETCNGKVSGRNCGVHSTPYRFPSVGWLATTAQPARDLLNRVQSEDLLVCYNTIAPPTPSGLCGHCQPREQGCQSRGVDTHRQ